MCKNRAQIPRPRRDGQIFGFFPNIWIFRCFTVNGTAAIWGEPWRPPINFCNLGKDSLFSKKAQPATVQRVLLGVVPPKTDPQILIARLSGFRTDFAMDFLTGQTTLQPRDDRRRPSRGFPRGFLVFHCALPSCATRVFEKHLGSEKCTCEH